MKLHSTSPTGLLSITSYDAAHIAVDGRRLQRSFLLKPQSLIESWSPSSFDDLNEVAIQAIADLNCAIVLLGTGARQRFPAPALLRILIERRVGVEVMDNFAACRTYNILIAEGRDVALAAIMESAENRVGTA